MLLLYRLLAHGNTFSFLPLKFAKRLYLIYLMLHRFEVYITLLTRVVISENGGEMQVILMDQHDLMDSRVNRHASFLSDTGFDVIRFNFDLKESDKISDMRLNNYTCHVIGMAYTQNLLLNKIIYTLDKITVNILRSEKAIIGSSRFRFDEPTIIHVHDPLLLPLAKRLKKSIKRSKLVYDRHEAYEVDCCNYMGIPLGRVAESLTAVDIDGVVVVTDEYISTASKFFPGAAVEVVPNYPVSGDYNDERIMDKISGTDDDTTLVFSYIGSLWGLDRDVDLMLKIADRLLSAGRNVKFFIGGGTEEKLPSEIYEMSKRFPDRFFFLGYVERERAKEITEGSHFGLLLIKPETNYWVPCSPNKVFEYLRCGVIPIIRADCVNKETIAPASLFFERYDDEEYIIETIDSLLSDTGRIVEMMKKAYKISEDYLFEKVSDNYLKLYNKIL